MIFWSVLGVLVVIAIALIARNLLEEKDIKKAITLRDGKTLLVPIYSNYTDLIYKGEKEWEFRKTFPKKPVKRMLFYETSPVKAITGEAKIEVVVEDDKYILWRKTKFNAGITGEDYFTYFLNNKTGVAFKLCKVKKYDKPILLSEIGISSAPQSYRYL